MKTKLFKCAATLCAVFGCLPAMAQSGQLQGKVQGAGSPIAGSTVTLYAAGDGKPVQLAEGMTGDDGAFKLDVGGVFPDKGPNDAIALLSVLGTSRPTTVTINEMTTVASVWTNNQFLDGKAIKGHALGLKIAAGNVPNFVDLQA